MATTISNGTDTLTPALVDGWDAERSARTIVHEILGTNEPAVTLRPHGLRTGTLTVVVGTSATLAGQLDDMLRAGDVLTLASTEQPSVGMTFVANGRIRTSLDATRKVWVIEAEFHEVAT